jgi:hypothetical protein
MWSFHAVEIAQQSSITVIMKNWGYNLSLKVAWDVREIRI